LQLFDAHMHYSDTHGPAFDAVRERHGVGACTLACIPQMGVCSTVPDALYYKAVHPEGTVYVMGGLERSAWFLHEGDAAALGEDLVAQAGALLAAGCDGIKLLEGKPDIRRNFPIPDFDTPAWEPFWRWAEEQRVPILWHVNDPEEFWDASRINPYAKSEGWFYGPETINNEEQYRQVFAVLACHPGLRLQLAHLFFFSAQLPRLSALLRRYPEVRVDLTPGIELYTNLAGDIPAARAFFEEFGTRILYGSDIGSRASIAQPPRPLDSSESAARVDVIRTFLETPENEPYTLLPDGRYLFRIAPTPMRGLGLPSEALEQVYGGNARMFLGRARPVDAAKAASLARWFGLLCVKCVGLGGQIYGNPGDPMWLQVDAEKRISFENPMRAAEADTRLVRDTLFTANLRGIQVETVCVFTNKKATLALPRGTGHYTLKDFKALLGKSKYEQDKGVDIPQTVDAVKKWVVEG